MNLSSESLSTELVLVVFALFLFFGLLNIYLIFRDGFNVPVNCWFCNKNTKVLYSFRNSFECPYCRQYNGFNKDGDYNKVIQEQYDFSTNNIRKRSVSASNGLCNICNNNEQLKVIQLSNFVPLNEKNYDVEIEHFEKQLEKAYKLCKKCEKVLKTTIRKQNAWLFGNRLKELRNKTIFLFEKSEKLAKTTKHPYLRTVFLILAVLILFSVSAKYMQFAKNVKEIKTYIPQGFATYEKILLDLYSNASSVLSYEIKNINKHLPINVQFQTNHLITLTNTGFILQLVSIFFENFNLWKVNELLCWSILVLSSCISFPQNLLHYLDFLQVFCSLCLIYAYGYTTSTNNRQPQKSKYVFKKLIGTTENNDYSDLEEHDISESNTNIKGSVNNKNYLRSAFNTANRNRLNRSFNSVRNFNKTASSSVLNHSTSTETLSDCSEASFTTSKTTKTVSTRKNMRNNELNKSFSGLNLGAFRSPVRDSISPVFSQTRYSAFSSPFASFTQSPPVSPNNYFVSPNQTSPSQQPKNNFYLPQSPQNNLFLPQKQTPNYYVSHNRSSLSPKSYFRSEIFSPNKSFLSPNQHLISPNNSFRPLSPVNSISSQRSILSPPKLNYLNNSFGFAQKNLICASQYSSTAYQNSWTSRGLFKNVDPDFHKVDQFLKKDDIGRVNGDSSRSSSRSSGFFSNNELNNVNSVSLPCSRSQSPERSSQISEPPYHFKGE